MWFESQSHLIKDLKVDAQQDYVFLAKGFDVA
jgi:hypothetical protein